MAPAALEFGPRGDKSIKGPTTWNGFQVYERLNRDKLQLFAIRDDRTGLGRVFDSRYPQLGCRGEVKFPLGRWKQGEVREYQLDCARGKRPLKVTIEEIDFVYDGVPHSLRFHWLFMEGRGRGTDMRYVYSPLRGLVDVRLDAVDGTSIATCELRATGSNGVYTSQPCAFTGAVSGSHRIYLTFRQAPGGPATGFGLLNWVEFSGPGISAP